MDNGEFEQGGGGGGGGGPVAAAAVAVAVVDDRDRWWWRLMAAAALDRGLAITSWRSKRVAKQEKKRAAQGEAMQQPANLPLCSHFDMQRCHLSCHNDVTQHCWLPCRHGDTWHCLWLRGNGDGKE